MNNKLKRTIPFVKLLKNQKSNAQKRRMLKSFPGFVVNDMIEILYNIIHENVPLRNSKHRLALLKRRRGLTEILKSLKHKKKRKQLIYKQSGGFIGAILPVVASVLGGLFGSVV